MATDLDRQIMAMTEIELRAALLQLASGAPDAVRDAVERTLRVTRKES